MKKLILSTCAIAIAGGAFADDLKICVEGAYPPFSETNESGDVVGFDIDIANALCGEMGNNCEMVKVDWDGIIPALTEQKCDAIVASMTITPERQEVVDFTAKYYTSPIKIVAKEGASMADLAGKKVGVQRGTVMQEYMEAEYPDIELGLYGTQDDAFLDLASGRVDAVAAEALQADIGFLKGDDGAGFAFVADQKEVPGDEIGIAVRKEENELRDGLSAAIQTIRDNGAYKEINDKYFGYDIY